MQVEKRDGTSERRVLIGMIVDTQVCGAVAPKWSKDGLFQSQASNVVGQWCVDYYNRYGTAPDKAVESIYESWADAAADKATAKLVEKLLGDLSGEYARLKKESNSQYIIDLASKHFSTVRAKRFIEQARGDIDLGEAERVFKRAGELGRVDVGVGAGIDVLRDTAAIQMAFASRGEPLIQYPGALGSFFGQSLERDGFIAFMGMEKVGKTFWKIDLAWRAMLQSRRVAFFEVGDLSQNQIMRRFMVRAAGRPLDPSIVKRPISIEHSPDDAFATVSFEERTFKQAMGWKDAQAACDEIIRKAGGNECLLKLSTHPNDSISVLGIEAILTNWERVDGWSPDIVVVDYSDILAPCFPTTETREAINTTWKRLRALSQSRHCLVVTGTQSDADSYRAERLDKGNFSGDKRKYAHVTGMVGINVTMAEKEQMLTRLNWLVLREGEFSEDKCVHAAGALALANPAVLSTF